MNCKCFIVAAMISLAWGSDRAFALLTIDQENDLIQSVGGTLTFTNYEIGQTFTVGRTGQLGQVDLALGTVGAPTGPLLFEIRNVLAGLPVDGTPLYQGTIPLGDIPPRGSLSNFPLVPVDLLAANLMVNAGDELALVVARDAPHGFDNTILWERGLPGYDEGDSMTRFGTQAWSVHTTPYDYGFRTWVDSNTSVVPGPAYQLFETTRALPPNDNTFSGLNANSQNFSGVNFEIVRPTKIKSIGGHFLGSATGQVFGAIVQLDDRNGAPDPTDLSGTDVLGSTLIDLPGGGLAPADASGDLDLTLQPGHYGLWFGSGQFGATGNGVLSTENDPTGAWSVWTLQQPSGNRNFLGADIRVFIEAESTPGTLQVRSTFDVAAEDFGSGAYVLEDGEGRIELDSTPFGSAEKRGILEFDISNIPANAVIESVLLEIDTNGSSTNGVSDPKISLYGYQGDGVSDPADALQTSTLIGTSPGLEDLGMFSVSIDPAYVQSLIGSDFLGLVATSTNPNSSIDFHPTENRGHGEAPLLTIVLSVPGDFDGDLDVNGSDFLAWQRGESPNSLSASDLAKWQANYGNANALQASSIVPEPTSLVWQLLAIVVVCCRGRR